MSEIYHYTLNSRGGIDTAPAATDRPCIAYLHPERDTLCIMEGGAYHQFDLSELGVARLAAECSKRIWDRGQQK